MRGRLSIGPGLRAASRLAVAVTVLTLALPASAVRNEPWSDGTAYTLPADRVEMGLFQWLRWGVTDQIELSTPPLLTFVMPSLSLKVAWWARSEGQIATETTLSYPTPLLMILSREGTGGIMPADTKVPHIVSVKQLLLYTAEMVADQSITLKFGAIMAGTAGENTMPTIDLPLVYPRHAAWHQGITGVLGVDFDGIIWGPLRYTFDLDVFLMPDRVATAHIEHSGVLSWVALDWLAFHIGYKVVWGQYPFGTQTHVFPLFDVNFALWR